MRRQLFYDANTRQQLTPRETTVLSAAKNYNLWMILQILFHIPQSIVLRHLSNIINKLNSSDQKLAHQLVYAYKLTSND